MEQYLNRGVTKIDIDGIFNAEEVEAFKILGQGIKDRMPTQGVDKGILIYEASLSHEENRRAYVVLDKPAKKDHQLLTLQRPIYTKRETETEIVLDPSGYLHTIQLNPTKLLLYHRFITQIGVGYPSEYLKELMYQSAGILLNQASVEDIVKYAREKRGSQRFAWALPQASSNLDPNNYYQLISQEIFPTLEIHDLIIHPTQFRTWPDFFLPLTEIASYARQTLQRGHRFIRFLDFAYFASAEYGVVGNSIDDAAALGCLVYTYPRKNPMRYIDITLIDEPEKLLAKWEALRASASLSRRNAIHGQQLGQPIDWYEQLGYALPIELKPFFQPSMNRYIEPIANLKEASMPISTSEVSFPSTIEDLMERIIKLLKREVIMVSELPNTSLSYISNRLDKMKVA